MRHQRKKRILGRVRKERKALLRSLADSLICHTKIKTTEAKAKELRPFVERLITFAKTNTVAKRRQARRFLSKEATKKLFDVLGKKYSSRAGGYTRIIKIPSQRQDQAKIAVIELLKGE